MTEITTTATALPSKLGNSNNPAVARKRSALGDVTNAHKKTALGDITNAVVKRDLEKPAAKRPIARKPSTANVKKPVETKPLSSKQAGGSITSTTVTTTTITTTTASAAAVIPKKRPSEALAPRRALKQSTSTSSLAQKTNARVVSRRRAEEAHEPEVPRKKQKLEQKQDWDDLDSADANDPLMVSEYVVEIFDYMRELEASLLHLQLVTVGQNDAQSKLHEIPGRPRVAHARDSGRLAY